MIQDRRFVVRPCAKTSFCWFAGPANQQMSGATDILFAGLLVCWIAGALDMEFAGLLVCGFAGCWFAGALDMGL